MLSQAGFYTNLSKWKWHLLIQNSMHSRFKSQLAESRIRMLNDTSFAVFLHSSIAVKCDLAILYIQIL